MTTTATTTDLDRARMIGRLQAMAQTARSRALRQRNSDSTASAEIIAGELDTDAWAIETVLRELGAPAAAE